MHYMASPGHFFGPSFGFRMQDWKEFGLPRLINKSLIIALTKLPFPIIVNGNNINDLKFFFLLFSDNLYFFTVIQNLSFYVLKVIAIMRSHVDQPQNNHDSKFYFVHWKYINRKKEFCQHQIL